MALKRKRDPVFIESEKMALIELVERHFDIVESKKTDAVSVRTKGDEWRQMALEFNSTSSIRPREWTVLKNCWDNLKKKAKHSLTQMNQHFIGTGGGPPKKFDDDPVLTRVLELIQARVSGFVNCYDSDGTLVLDTNTGTSQLLSNELQIDITCTETETVKSTQSSSQLQSNELQIASSGISNVTSSTLPDWSQYTPRMLRDSRNPLLYPSPEVLLVEDHHLPIPAAMVDPTNDNVPEVLLVEDHHLPTPATTVDTTNNNINTPRRNNPHGSAVPAAAASRRRPVLRRDREAQSLAHEKLNTLLKVNMQTGEQHEIQLKILRLQEQREEVMLQREKEMLEQEKLKTLQERINLEISEHTLKIKNKKLVEG